MYQISSKTGVRHAIEGDLPDNLAALDMLRGKVLPITSCGKQLQPVNFYEAAERPNPHYVCGRCFGVVR